MAIRLFSSTRSIHLALLVLLGTLTLCVDLSIRTAVSAYMFSRRATYVETCSEKEIRAAIENGNAEIFLPQCHIDLKNQGYEDGLFSAKRNVTGVLFVNFQSISKGFLGLGKSLSTEFMYPGGGGSGRDPIQRHVDLGPFMIALSAFGTDFGNIRRVNISPDVEIDCENFERSAFGFGQKCARTFVDNIEDDDSTPYHVVEFEADGKRSSGAVLMFSTLDLPDRVSVGAKFRMEHVILPSGKIASKPVAYPYVPDSPEASFEFHSRFLEEFGPHFSQGVRTPETEAQNTSFFRFTPERRLNRAKFFVRGYDDGPRSNEGEEFEYSVDSPPPRALSSPGLPTDTEWDNSQQGRAMGARRALLLAPVISDCWHVFLLVICLVYYFIRSVEEERSSMFALIYENPAVEAISPKWWIDIQLIWEAVMLLLGMAGILYCCSFLPYRWWVAGGLVLHMAYLFFFKEAVTLKYIRLYDNFDSDGEAMIQTFTTTVAPRDGNHASSPNSAQVHHGQVLVPAWGGGS